MVEILKLMLASTQESRLIKSVQKVHFEVLIHYFSLTNHKIPFWFKIWFLNKVWAVSKICLHPIEEPRKQQRSWRIWCLKWKCQMSANIWGLKMKVSDVWKYLRFENGSPRCLKVYEVWKYKCQMIENIWVLEMKVSVIWKYLRFENKASFV